MLADPRSSRVILINPTRGDLWAAADLAARHIGLSLLQAGVEMFGVPSAIVGNYSPFNSRGIAQLVQSMTQLDVDALSIWQDRRFTDSLISSETGIILFGGAWLEEEIFIAAIQGAERGYDVRVMSDLAQARVNTDRSLVFDRLALHGILATTVRQTLLEWAVSRDDPLLKQKVQQLWL